MLSSQGQSNPLILIEDPMKTIQRIKVMFRELRDNKVDEQRGRPGLICEGFRHVLAERDSLKHQLTEAKRTIADLEKNTNRDFQAQEFLHHQSVCEKVKMRFEHRIQSKDEKIRLLKHEVAMKDEEIRSLKSQQDRREEEYGRLRNNIHSACTDMQNAVATLGSAFIFRAQSPPEKGNDYSYDLIGATPSVGYEMLKYLFKE